MAAEAAGARGEHLAEAGRLLLLLLLLLEPAGNSPEVAGGLGVEVVGGLFLERRAKLRSAGLRIGLSRERRSRELTVLAGPFNGGGLDDIADSGGVRDGNGGG